ncbi:MAG: DUF5682 family protein [Rhodocyclaceae bacterium]
MLDAAQAARLLAPDARLRLVPVRHHSPRCAHHLRAVLQAFAPDVVLIEGPRELDALLPALQHERARPPLAAYLHAQAGEGARCRAYVPFAEFSPEWVALREAGRLGVAVRFIDLPYGAWLDDDADARFFATAPEPTLDAEPARQAPDVIARLVEAAACRDFDEWWDRHFESGVAPASAEAYFAGLLGFSLLLRTAEAGALPDARNAAREAYMAACVSAELQQGARCLVVCGGYHVPGILAGLQAHLPAVLTRRFINPALEHAVSVRPERVEGRCRDGASTGSGRTAGGKSNAQADVGGVAAHLIVYSLGRLARATGYAAGLPAPGYYQAVWQAWEKKGADRGSCRPHEAAWPELAARLSGTLRAHGLPATLPDASEAVALAGRLAALRGHPGGRAELTEALRATLVKGSDDDRLFEQALAIHFDADDHVGRLPPNAPQAPLLLDAQAFCTRHRLPARPAAARRKTLDVYRSARHREVSQGLHRLCFLGVPYASRQAGPDFVQGIDLARVRELWTVQWQLETATALTEAARYGDSLEAAAVGRLLEMLDRPGNRNPAGLVLEVLVMGLDAQAGRVLDAVAQWLASSLDPLALAHATAQLALAFEMRNALGGVGMPRLLPLLHTAFGQACARFPALGQGDAGQAGAALDALADLHGMVRRNAEWADGSALFEACAVLHQASVPASVRGAAAGVLTLAGQWSAGDTGRALAGALALARVAPQLMGEYLQGFLHIARGWLLSHPPALQQLSACIGAWSEEDFLEGLPALRLAFAQLSRRELGELARLLGAPPATGRLAALPVPDVASLRRSAELARQTRSVMQAWGFDA